MLPRILSLLNNSISLVTGYAPSELFLNYSAIDQFKKSMNWPEDIYPLDYKDRLLIVEENINRSHKKRKKLKGRGEILSQGDLVFIRSHRHSSAIDKVTSKYFLPYYGPFLVKKVLRNCAVLSTLEGKDIGTQNFNNLKLFKCSDERKAELIHDKNT